MKATARLLVLLLLGLFAATPAVVADDEETRTREVYVPHPEFRSYPEQDRLAVESVTLIRVRRCPPE